MKNKKTANNFWIYPACLCIISFLLYFPIINKSFACDDFIVLKRIAVDKIIFVKNFFRPLSDITLYFNYLLNGFHPWGYYVFGILIHTINSFLLFLFCLKWKWTENISRQKIFASTASLLFLTYPFHNECIAWVVGRASLMASTFGILSLLILVGNIAERKKIFLISLCWFIGLTSYESIFVLPLLIAVILYKKEKSLSQYIYWIIALTGTFILHFIVRIEISGGFLGTYGKSFFGQQIKNYAGNVFKVAARLFLPPIENAHLATVVFIALAVLLTTICFLFYKNHSTSLLRKIYFSKMLLLSVIASVIPVLFSISTKTSESDRFLYFPSFFVCAAIAFLLINVLSGRPAFIVVLFFMVCYNIFFLEKNNYNWIKASHISEDILNTMKLNQEAKNIFVINLPDEMDGAFIFRQGFEDALTINGIKNTNVKIVNHLLRSQMLRLPDTIYSLKTNNEIIIPPSATIQTNQADSLFKIIRCDSLDVKSGKEDVILYWNKHGLVKAE